MSVEVNSVAYFYWYDLELYCFLFVTLLVCC